MERTKESDFARLVAEANDDFDYGVLERLALRAKILWTCGGTDNGDYDPCGAVNHEDDVECCECQAINPDPNIEHPQVTMSQ